jgi:hypothetical protein
LDSRGNKALFNSDAPLISWPNAFLFEEYYRVIDRVLYYLESRSESMHKVSHQSSVGGIGRLTKIPCVLGRLFLLQQIGAHWPGFFISLNKLWNTALPLMQAGDTQQAQIEFLIWHGEVQICEGNDWLIRDVILPTLENWTCYPSSPAARLEPGACWWRYEPNRDEVFGKLPPLFGATNRFGTGAMDPIKQLDLGVEDRISGLRAWKKTVDVALGAHSDPVMMVERAKWTSLFLGGAAAREISDNVEGLRRNKRLRHPDKYVRSEIGRFAKSIALQLPKR